MKTMAVASSVVMWVVSAFAVQYVTNDTLVVNSELREGLSMNGGSIDYRYSNSRYLRSAILLTGASGVDTTYVVSGYGGTTPLSFQKDILSAAGAKLVLSCDFEFGAISASYNAGYRTMSDTSFGYDFWKNTENRRAVGYSGYPYVGPDSIRFTDTTSKLIIAGHAALTEWPRFPYSVATAAADTEASTSIAFLGPNLANGAEYELAGYDVVWAHPGAFAAETTVVVPSKRYLVCLREEIDPSPTKLEAVTQYLSYRESGNLYSNDVRLAGGTFIVAEQGAWYHYGAISGTGTVVMEAAAAKDGVIRAFRGSLDDFSGQVRVYSGAGASRMDGRRQRIVFSRSFALGRGDLYLYASTNCVTEVSFSPATGQAGDWYVSTVESEGVYVGCEAQNGDLAGSVWKLLPSQDLTIGTLRGGLAVIGNDRSTVTIGNLDDDTRLYLTNGVPLAVTNSFGQGVSIVYGDCSAQNDSLTVMADGGQIDEIVLNGNELSVSGNLEIDRVSGCGKLIVVGGAVRIGATTSTVETEVCTGAKVSLSGAGKLSEILSDSRLTLWLDASDLTSFRGVPATEKSRTTYPEWREIRTALGTDGLVYTNDFPLVDQWYDCRADRRPAVGADGYDASAYAQGKFYLYNDRKVRNGDSWPYPQFMPYVMTNQVNGKSVLSFDSPGASLDRTWAAKASGTVNVRRSMSLVYGAQRVYTAVMVFGSHEGGGRSVLGGYSQTAYGTTNAYTRSACTPYYTRGGTAAARSNPETAIFSSSRQTWLDGREVDPCATGYSGGYQVLSFDGKANYFRSLGYNQTFPTDGTECGGARYGEILIFGGTSSTSSPLSDDQRETIEQYLAQKWGIGAYRSPIAGPVTLTGGEVHTLGNYAPQGNGVWAIETDVVIRPGFTGVLSGKGNVKVDAAATMPQIDADFVGSVSVATNVLAFALSADGVLNASRAEATAFVFPSEVTIEISSEATRLPKGEFVLLSGASISGLENLTLRNLTGCTNRKFKLEKRGNQLVLKIGQLGLCILFR